MSRPGRAGPHRVEVAAERLPGWLERFARRHGTTSTVAAADEVVVTAADGSVARLEVPFPPLDVQQDRPDGGLAAHVARPRRVGVLLVRLGGHAAGIVEGDRIVTGRVGSRPVHGRSAAGGWSQQRFARRREGQAKVALGAAADVAVAVLLPAAATLDAVVLGGDRRALDTVLGDVRLALLRDLVRPPLLTVPDPRRAVLDAVPARLRSVRIQVEETPGQPEATRGQSRRPPE
jgi:hypothetical protein